MKNLKENLIKLKSKPKITIAVLAIVIVFIFVIYIIIAENLAKDFNEPFKDNSGNHDYYSTLSIIADAELENLTYVTDNLFGESNGEITDYPINIFLDGENVSDLKSSYYLKKGKIYNIKYKYNFFTRKINKIILKEI